MLVPLAVWVYGMLQGKEWVLRIAGCFCVYHVDMTSLAALRIQLPYRSGDPESPIPGLGDILLVAELEHQLVARFGILC